MNLYSDTNQRFSCPDCGSVFLKKNFKKNSKGYNECPICGYSFSFEKDIKENPSFLKIENETLKKMSVTYRKIRYEVFNEATRPINGNKREHEENKGKFKNKVVDICNNANLEFYSNSRKETYYKIWHHLWTKNRYAGIKARIASQEIEDIKTIFDDFLIFNSPNWNIEANGHKLIYAGSEAQNFLNRNGQFYGKQTIGNLPKLVKIVNVARGFIEFAKQNNNLPAINFLTNNYDLNDVWKIHNHLLSIGYTGDLTALHCMMDMGFQVMKPDIVISRLFLKLGWIHKIIPILPQDFKFIDLQGKGIYGSKYLYTKSLMYKPIIELSRLISSCTKRENLVKDIGWSTNNPLREFDIFMVKFGQQPESEWGITRTLL